MRRNFHASYAESEVKPPTDRSTGLVFALLGAVVALWWRNEPVVPWVALGVAVALAAVSLIAPKLLRPLTLVWFQIGLLVHRMVNPVVMFAIFAAVFVPAGMIMRIWLDPLRSRRTTQPGSTYWIERSANAQSAMTNQF
jgi:hypothetical protein